MSKAGKGWLIGIGTFVALVLIASTVLAFSYRQKFYPGSRIGTSDLSGKSLSDGKAQLHLLTDSYAKQRIVVEAPDLTKSADADTAQYPLISLTASAAQLGVTFSENEQLSMLWSAGHEHSLLAWIRTVPRQLFLPATSKLTYLVDPTIVSTYVHTDILPKLVTPLAPKVVISTASAISVSKSAPGLQLDENALTNRLQNALTTLSDGDVVYLLAPTKVIDSKITDAMVTPLATQLDALGNLQLILTVSGIYLKPTRAQLLTWFQTIEDDSGSLSLVLDQAAVTSYLTAANGQIDPLASTQTISTTLGPLIASTPRSLSIALVLKKIMAAQPIAGQFTLGREAGKYIEVDLHAQRLYRINGATLEKTYLISSGKASTPTPVGQFTINGHAKMAFSHLYGLYMPFWMNFQGGLYGLHELPVWPSGYREGANHLGIPVSDGCIRLGIGQAEELYDWTPDGTPLFVH